MSHGLNVSLDDYIRMEKTSGKCSGGRGGGGRGRRFNGGSFNSNRSFKNKYSKPAFRQSSNNKQVIIKIFVL